MKLTNGYGSIYKKKGNRRKPWAIVVTVGWTDEGKQIRKVLSYAQSQKEALKILADYHGNPYDLDYKNLTFAEVWRDVERDLEKAVEQNKMTISNLKGLSLAFKNHCKPLYNERVLELKYKRMQDVIDSANLGHTGKGYIKTVCKKIFDCVINKYELPIINNPTDKLSVGERKISTKHIPFTDDEINILWKNTHIDLVKILLIYLYTGERPNELFITQRDNIFLNEDYMVTGSKTEAGKNRIIPIHPKIKPLIKYFYDNGLEYPFKIIYDEFNYGKFSRGFTKLMEDFNFNHTAYDARHTFVSKMKRAGANEYILKRIVGHSINDITEKVYTHREIEELLVEINKID